LHTDGCGLSSVNATLWGLELVSSLSRDSNVTVPPTAISTELSNSPVVVASS
jgi:hypothetical protein